MCICWCYLNYKMHGSTLKMSLCCFWYYYLFLVTNISLAKTHSFYDTLRYTRTIAGAFLISSFLLLIILFYVEYPILLEEISITLRSCLFHL